MEDNAQNGQPEWRITTPTHLKSSVWKYFGFYTVDTTSLNIDAQIPVCARAPSACSTAGNIANKKRAALDPDQVDKLVFLANNIKK